MIHAIHRGEDLENGLVIYGFRSSLHDFGHVGIDFKVQNQFVFVNRMDVPIRINDIVVSCDCSSVHSKDSLVQPKSK